MSIPNFKLVKVDLTVTNMKKMVDFYSQVFSGKFRPVNMGPFEFYIGDLPGLFTLQLVPKEVTGNNAQQNRQQFNFRVDDLETIKKTTIAAGGKAVDGKDEESVFSVLDPDGNYIVFLA